MTGIGAETGFWDEDAREKGGQSHDGLQTAVVVTVVVAVVVTVAATAMGM